MPSTPSFVVYPSVNGSTSTFNVPFGYLVKTHVLVYEDDVLSTKTITWPTSSSIHLVPTPAAGTKLAFVRQTPPYPAQATFTSGPISSTDLNNNKLQERYIEEELRDKQARTFMVPLGSTPDPLPTYSALVAAVADAVGDDAVTLVNEAGAEQVAAINSLGGEITTSITGAVETGLEDIATARDGATSYVTSEGSRQAAIVAQAVNKGIFPDEVKALSSGGSGIVIAGGSGYTPGTYNGTLTGGGGSFMAVQFHVSAGGVIDEAHYLSRGYSYTSAPTVALTGAGAGSGGSITLTIAPRCVLDDYFETPSSTGYGARDLWRVTAGPVATKQGLSLPTQLVVTLENMAGFVPPTPLVEAAVVDATADPVPYLPNRKATHAVYTGANQEYGPPVLLTGWVRVGSGTRVWGQADSLGGQRGCLLTITGTDYFWRGNSCAAGTWKMGMRARTLTGTATVKLGDIGDTTNTVTFGTTSSDQEVTFTKGGTWNPQVAGPCALVIEEIWIAPSTATVAYPVPDGHFYFGASADSVRRPAKAGVSQVTFGANTQGWMALNAPVSANDFTVLGVVSQTGAIAGLSGILSAWPDATIMSLAINGNKLTMYKGGVALAARHSIDINGTGPRMVGMSYSTRRAGASLFLDDIEIEFQQQAVDTGRLLQEFCVGMLDQTSSRFVGDITPPEFWSRALSYEEIRRYFDVKKRRMALDGKSLFDPLNVAIFEGDSITGLPYTYVNSMTASLLAAGIQPVKFAWPSDGLQHLYDRSARVDAVIKPGRRTNLFLGPFAGNDFGGVGGNPVYSSIATWEDDFKVYLDRRYKAGVKRIDIITATPTTNANNTAAYDTLMAWYVANEGRYFDRVIPLRGSNPLGLNARAADTSKYADGTHPNAPAEMDLIGAFVLPYVLDAFKGPTPQHAGNYIPSVHPPITW